MKFNYDNTYDSYVAKEISHLTSQFFDSRAEALNDLEEPFQTRVIEYPPEKNDNAVTIAIRKETQRDIDRIKDLFLEITSWRLKNFFIFEAGYLAESMKIGKEAYKTKDFKEEFGCVFLAIYLLTIEKSTFSDSHIDSRCRESVSLVTDKLKNTNPAAYDLIQGYKSTLFMQNPFTEFSTHSSFQYLQCQEWVNFCEKFFHRCKGSFVINAKASDSKILRKRLTICYQTISLLTKHDISLYFNQKLSVNEIKSQIKC